MINDVYLDYQATTPVDPRVANVMIPFLTEQFANPSSPHLPGRRAANSLRTARRQVQAALGADRDTEIVFTSGATEANHLAIYGLLQGRDARASRTHVITTAVEHKSVLAALQQLRDDGHAVTVVPVDSAGHVDSAAIGAAITANTALVSVMYANNEIGTIQPIAELGELARRHGVLLHVDAAQAAGVLDIDVNRLGVDLLTISAHKIYGPKGIGALYIRHGTPIRAQYPGGQEYGFRAGTPNVPGAVGLAEALRIVVAERHPDSVRIAGLRDCLAERLLAAHPHAKVNGHPEQRLPGNLSLTIPGVDATDLVEGLPDVAISTGSACTSGQSEPSHVLTAIGLDSREARATIRISLGRFTTGAQVDHAAQRIASTVQQLISAV